MPLMCMDKSNGSIVMALRRTDLLTVFIGTHKNTRCILDAYNTAYDKQYRIIQHDVVRAAETWLRSTLKIQEKAKGVLEMIVQLKGTKVVGKFEDGATVPNDAGVKLFSNAADLEALGAKTLTRVFNGLVAENKQLDGFADAVIGAASTWDAMVNFDIPAPKIKEKKPKKENTPKEPKGPKQYDIPAGSEQHEYREGTGMRNMVEALKTGATWDELATIANTNLINVKHRVLHVMPKDGYGIRSEGDKFFVVTQ